MDMRTGRWTSLALACVALAALAGCSSSDKPPLTCPAGETGAPPNCVAIAPPCTQSVVYNTSGSLDARTLYADDFSVADSGRLDMTLDWTNATSRMGLYLVAANTCSLEEFNARSCNFLVRSEPPGTKPRKVSAQNLAAGNYRWLIANFADVQESAALQVVLSKGTCSPLAGAVSANSATGDLDLPRLERSVAAAGRR
jgi:hypothetical protein